MNQRLLLVLFLFTSISILSQNGNRSSVNGNTAKLYVAFSSEFKFDHSSSYIEQAELFVPKLKHIVQQMNFSLMKGINISDEKFDNMEKEVVANGYEGSSIKNLRNIFMVDLVGANYNTLELVAKELENSKGIRYCQLISSEVPPPPGDILPITPSFVYRQDYIAPNPGVNMQYAWDIGATGQNIKIRDVEFGFYKSHEEFNDKIGAKMASGMNISSEVPFLWKEHGTAVFGVIYGDNGTYGITGLAHNAQELILFPEWQASGYDRINAVSQSINQSTNGDIIVFEMQDFGQDNQFVPAEFNNVVWDLTRAATDLGITIVAAAGNGSENLDDSFYNDYNNRGDSGAIIIGAGTPDIEHNILASTFGNRVDLHGWGSNVYTAGYYSIITQDTNQRYGYFSGTSSATAVVASCVAVLQSHYHTIQGGYLSPVQLRNILKLTGVPQGSGGNIGPLPNMQAAIEYVNTLSLDSPEQNFFFIAPNPTQRNLNVYTKETIEAVDVFDIMGKRQAAIKLSGTSYDVSHLNRGIYFINIVDTNGKKFFSKFIKY